MPIHPALRNNPFFTNDPEPAPPGQRNRYTVTTPSGQVTVDPDRPSLLARVFPSVMRLEKSVADLSKQAVVDAAPRPAGDIIQAYQFPGIRAPKNPYRMADLYWLNRTEPVLRTCTYNIREEIFRRGVKWEDNFAYKCTKCGEEFDDDPSEDNPNPETSPGFGQPSPNGQEPNPPSMQKANPNPAEGEESAPAAPPLTSEPEDKPKLCPECNGELREPSQDGVEEADKFFERVNGNGQSLLDVLRQFEDDINICDDGYLVVRKEYTLTKEHKIAKEEPLAIVRANPDILRICADRTEALGGTYWFCPEHRKAPDLMVWTNPKAKEYTLSGFLGQGPERPDPKDIPACRYCKKPLWEAAYVATYDGVNPEYYYADHEVIHKSRYEPSATYGFAPTVTLWTVATCLLNQEKYLAEYYREMRMPPGVLVVTTDNPNAAVRSWDIAVQRAREDPWFAPMWPVSSQRGKGDAKYVEFRQTPKEMELIAVRDEFRQRASSLYGVANIFMGDVQSSGGLNAENLQVTVTNRALERGQRTYTDAAGVFPVLTKLFGIEDKKLTFPRLELDEEREQLDVELKNLQFAQGVKNLGYEVEIDEDEDGHHEFTYTKVQTPMMPMGPGGFEGEGGGGIADRIRALKPGESMEVGPEDVGGSEGK